MNSTFYEGIDYTFRKNFDLLFNKEKKEEVNHLKHRKNEEMLRMPGNKQSNNNFKFK